MSAHPLVSIIVPVYNVESYLDACLHSVRQQTYSNIEILVVEDCSTDDSLRLLRPHLADLRVRLLRHERNSGLSAARNTGIEAARGAYVMFVDSDDIVDTSLVAVCVETATRTGAQVVLYGFTSFPDGQPVPMLTAPARIAPESAPLAGTQYFTYPHFAWLKFIQSSVLRDQRLRFPIGIYYEDWPFHWELGFVAQRIERIDRPLYAYRQRSTSITGEGGGNLFHQFTSQIFVYEIITRHKPPPEFWNCFADSVYRSVWFVLYNVRSELLKVAIIHTRSHLSNMHFQRQYKVANRKIRALLIALRFPDRPALASIRAIRYTARFLSSRRRFASKQAAE
jgi:glycosyltransferase involved in cell wall biosynthesis